MTSFVLGIESSCDESSVALVNEKYEVLYHLTSSQSDLHAEYGGVVPELASRRHIVEIFRLLHKLQQKHPSLYEDINAVAVTCTPGLIGSLLIGVETAKTLALCLNTSLIPVNHLKAHLFAASFDVNITFPFLGVIVSGGHTLLCIVKSYDDLTVVAQSCDDAVGEAYDKVAKVLDYGYPGGPVIDKIHQQYQGEYIDFPQPMKNRLDFSLSGLKTAVIRYVLQNSPLDENMCKKVAASFQETILEMMRHKIMKALQKYPVDTVVVVGGVSANKGLRIRLKELPVSVIFPSFEYCTDNAAMVAGLGMWYYQCKQRILLPGTDEFLKLNACPTSQL